MKPGKSTHGSIPLFMAAIVLVLAVVGQALPVWAVTPMIAAGNYHSVALKADGTVMTWGYNYYGQLGDGTQMTRYSPVAVPGLTGIVAVAAGRGVGSAYHTVAVKSDGTVVAWGDNSVGQLGDGTDTQRLSPVPVLGPGLTGVVAVAAGMYHTVALKSDGTVVTWGCNYDGQLGNGINTYPNNPTAVPGLSGVAAVSAGSNHTVALKSDGTVVAWGYNGFGQLGDGTTIGRLSPVAVGGNSNLLKSSQTVSFDTAPMIAFGGTSTVLATATSGLAVSFTSITPSICTVNGNIVTGIAAGTCFIVADQAGDANYLAADQVGQSITIGGIPDGKDPNNTQKSNSQAAGTDKNAPGMCSPPSSASRDPVDLATGNFYDTLNLMQVAAAGAPLQMRLSYNSGNPMAGNTGFGWGHPYQHRLADFTTSIKIIWPDSHVSIYSPNGAGGYTNAAADVADTLSKNLDGSYTLTDRRQKTYNFDASGKLASTVDRLGFIRNFTYANGNLDKVTDALSGRFLQFGYDAQNRVTGVTSADAGSVALAYDANGDLVSVTDALGNVTGFTYDANHRLLSKINALGATTVTNTYDAAGRVISQDDGLPATPLEQFTYATDADTDLPYTSYLNRTGGSTQYNFDGEFNLRRTVDPLGGTELYGYNLVMGMQPFYRNQLNKRTSFTYDTSGYILTRTDALGHVASYTYDASHNILSSTDEAGHVTSMTYGANHQLLTRTDAGGSVTTYTYNAQGLPATVTAPKSGVTSHTYDAQGNLTSQVDPAGSTSGYTYDAAGRMLTRTDGAGNAWAWTYDLMGQVLSVADPLGHTTSYSYDALGRVATKTAPGGGVTRFAYDIHDNLTGLTDALGDVTTFAYDADDHMIGATDALGRVTTLTRDAKGRVTATTDALGNITRKNYNAADDVTGTQDALNNQSNFAYDELRRLTAVTDPLNKSTTLAYDAVSHVTSRTDAKGNTSSFGYDALGQMASATNALGGTASQAFDQNGNRVSFTDASGNVTTFTLDAANRITRITTADGGAINYTYNNRSLIATATNARGQVATYTYDTAGQLVTLADAAGTTTFTYDADGNVMSVGDARGTSSYTYDLLNRITGYIDVFGNTIGYAYDAVGNLTMLTYPGNKAVTYAYDAANRMASVTDWSGHVTAYTYDARGNMTAITRANGTHGAYTYDAKGQVTAIAETTTGSASLYGIAYTYDANGNITSEVATSAATPPVIPVSAMTYGADNRLTTANGQSVTYDADGNMTSGPLNGVASAYSFDARSRLAGVGTSSYVYDAQGNRISATNAGVVTRYVVDPNAALPRVLMETDATGTPIAYYVYGMGLISRESAAGTYQTYHYDLRGSTLKLVGSTGVVTDSYRYGPYGELLATTGATSNPFRYNGRDGVTTEANGLYFMRARYYLPEARRFVSRDMLLGSVGQTLTLNRFAYVNGNPVGFVDPMGLVRWRTLFKGLAQVLGGTAVIGVSQGVGMYAGAGIMGMGMVDIKAGLEEDGMAAVSAALSAVGDAVFSKAAASDVIPQQPINNDICPSDGAERRERLHRSHMTITPKGVEPEESLNKKMIRALEPILKTIDGAIKNYAPNLNNLFNFTPRRPSGNGVKG